MEVYEQSVVAFIDILGFKEALRVPSKAKGILDALEQVKEQIKKLETDPFRQQFEGVYDIKLMAFSDSIIISGSEDKAVVVLFAAVEFSQILIEKGFLCRGGVACGELYHKNEIIFGNAFVKAYEIESKQAVYPRIVLDARTLEVVEDSKNNVSDFKNLIRMDKDGCEFINILYPIYKEKRNLKLFLSKMVRNKLNEKINTPCITKKLTWLCNEYSL